MIAAEALFLGEDGQGETGELTQKISTRFAFFAPIPNTTRRQRYLFMKRAYGARSRIVHGSQIKGLDTPEKLLAFTNQTADYLRPCLRAMIERGPCESQSKAVDRLGGIDSWSRYVGSH